MPKPLFVHGSSDIGRVRRRNEDSFALAPELGIAVVADGMGGHPGGDVASRIAADHALELLSRAVESANAASDFAAHVQPLMAQAVLTAHDRIREEGARDPDLVGMGTTLTAMVADPESRAYAVGHVGDSRAYLFRDGTLSQLTRDDTWVQQQIDIKIMNEGQARRSPYAHLLTQCLGLDDAPTPQVFHGQGNPGDAYLLCSDGLVGMLEDARISEILVEHLSTSDESDHERGDNALAAMLAAANDAGGHDNITVALVRFG